MPHVSRTTVPRIAIIGAGMAGVSCGQALQAVGLASTLFEKSRGPGGRLATRRNDAGVAFDHGAQYLTARGAAFEAQLDALQRAGAVARWLPRESPASAAHRHAWIVGTPGMSALLKPMIASLDLRTGVAVEALQHAADGWHLQYAGAPLAERFDIVICTAPAPQTRVLLAVDPLLQRALDAVEMAPCWALMLTLRTPLPVDFDACRFGTGAVAWLARQASRPQRDSPDEAWVVHASPSWSEQHLEQTADAVAIALQSEVAAKLGVPLPAVNFAQAHRWRYALTTRALGQPFLAGADGSLLAGGDWCLGARVECAFQSGVAMATAVIDRFSAS
jgi:renalase